MSPTSRSSRFVLGLDVSSDCAALLGILDQPSRSAAT